MRRWLNMLFVLVLLPPSGSRAVEAPRVPVPQLRIIAHPSNPATSIDRKFLAAAFLKKATLWPDDRVIRPVDAAAQAPVRRAFSDVVLQRSVDSVKSYWQQVIFAGHGVPPPELATDAEIVGYVLRTPGGIGYVSAAADIDGAKVLQVR